MNLIRIRSLAYAGVLILIVISGFFFRFHGLNLDEGTLQHPDERFLCMVVDKISFPPTCATYFATDKSPLNPYNCGFSSYVYGSLPLFLTRALATATGSNGLQGICQTGRLLSVVADCVSILLTFLLVHRLFGRKTAWTAAAVYAWCVFPIQQAHFFTVDSLAACCILATLFCCVESIRNPSFGRSVCSGLLFGLALSCRINLILFIPLLVLTGLFSFNRAHPFRTGCRPLVSVVMALLTFRILQPYAFSGLFSLSTQWLQDIQQVIRISTGEYDVPFTRQWTARPAYWFPLYNLLIWGCGLLPGLLALAGMLQHTVRLLRSRVQDAAHPTPFKQHSLLLLLLWCGLLFLYHGQVFLKTMRYFLPLYPLIALFAADFSWHLSARIRTLQPRALKKLWLLPPVVLLLSALGWATAFSSIYHHSHTRISASTYIYEMIPVGSTLAVEIWDDRLPLALPDQLKQPSDYRYEDVALYDEDTPVKWQQIIKQLDRADYIILASNRLYDSIPRQPWRYPVSIRYYTHLFNGSLGFERVYDGTSFPSIGGLTIPDLDAEEAFSVYDHPRVQIFKKTADWDSLRAYQLLTRDIDWKAIQPISAFNMKKQGHSLISSQETTRKQLHSGTWAKQNGGLFNRDSFSNKYPIICWLIMLDVLALIAFPIIFSIFPCMAYRGWLTARLVGTLLVVYPAWLSASLGLTSFSGTPLWVFVLLLLPFSLLIAFRRRVAIHSFFRDNCLQLIGLELLMLSIFFAFLFIRSGNPDLWHPYFGGEKPMDFAYFNAVLKTSQFPPYNPWMAGEHLNYYYLGFLLPACWTRLTGIIPTVSYNLSIATLAALTGALAYSFSSHLGAVFSTHRKAPVICGLSAVFLLLFCGNLHQWVLLFQHEVLPWDWFWTSSRAISVPAGEIAPITEFPFFTFMFGDLHAHMLDIPIFLLLLLCCLHRVLQHMKQGPSLMSELRFAGAAICCSGFIYGTNAWDYPAALLLIGGTCMLTIPSLSFRHMARAAGWTLLILIGGKVLFLPFHLHFLSGYSAFTVWTGPRSPFLDLLLIHGMFLIPCLIALLWKLRHRNDSPSRTTPLFMFWLGCLLLAIAMIIGVEWIVLKGDIGRMNTVFKFYLQVWILLALCTGSAAGALLLQQNSSRTIRILLAIPLILPALAGLLYPLQAVRTRFRDRFDPSSTFSLDGASFMNTAVYDWEQHHYPLQGDADAIRWMQQSIYGTPVIIEAQLPEYRWGSRFSIYTGLPTVIGWTWHQRQQHAALPNTSIDRRIQDVATFYQTPSPLIAQRIAKKYNAKFFVVGPTETTTYPAEGIRKFANAVPAYWTVAYSNQAVTIYAVP